MKKGTRVTVPIEKLVFGGQGLGKTGNKVLLAWNALPDETVECEITKNKKTYCEAITHQVIKPSPYRINPSEDHFLSCSPWQILTWEEENLWKKRIAIETYEKIGHFSVPGSCNIISNNEQQYNYRNKIEYSFTINEVDNNLSLAFFKRASHTRIPIQSCDLAVPSINHTAQSILEWLKTYKFPVRSLKSLIVRCNGSDETIAALFIKDHVSFIKFPILHNNCNGLHIFYSNPHSPASRPDKLLHKQGDDTLYASINNKQLKFGLLSFFQVNIPIFNHVINDIKLWLDPKLPFVDFYAGVGAISIPLSDFCKNCVLVENNEEAVRYAQENITANDVKNYSVIYSSTEKALDSIQKESIIVFDPPRSGLHKKIISQILTVKPIRIIYLSCNLSTQARDIAYLLSVYKVKFVRLYNFFPRSPHFEGLCVLDRLP